MRRVAVLRRQGHGRSVEVADELVDAACDPKPALARGECDLVAVGGCERPASKRQQLCVPRAPSRGSATRVSMERVVGFDRLWIWDLRPNDANAANSSRRPVRVASAIRLSMWSEKNWNGASSPYSSPMNRSGVNGEAGCRTPRAAARAAAFGRQRRDCRPGRDSVSRRRTVRAVRRRPGRPRGAVGPASSGRRRRTAVARLSPDPRSCRNRRSNPLAHRSAAYAAHDGSRRPKMRRNHSPLVIAAALRPGRSGRSPRSQRVRIDRVDAPGDLGDDVLGAGIEDRVDRVEPQAVDAEFVDPALGRLQHPLADRVAVDPS